MRSHGEFAATLSPFTGPHIAAAIVGQSAVGAAWAAAWNALSESRRALGYPEADVERRRQRLLLAEVFGNPFRPSTVDQSWLRWNDGTVRRIATGIYEERQLPAGTLDTTRLAVLADALLDAGCEDEALMQHCREPGPHVRGCWVVDLILGKS
jgi:hypothetical protein